MKLCFQVFSVEGRNEAGASIFAEDTAEGRVRRRAFEPVAMSLSNERGVFAEGTLPHVRRSM